MHLSTHGHSYTWRCAPALQHHTHTAPAQIHVLESSRSQPNTWGKDAYVGWGGGGCGGGVGAGLRHTWRAICFLGSSPCCNRCSIHLAAGTPCSLKSEDVCLRSPRSPRPSPTVTSLRSVCGTPLAARRRRSLCGTVASSLATNTCSSHRYASEHLFITQVC